MAIMVTISSGILLLLISFQNVLAQQLMNNNVGFNPGTPQQSQAKPTCGPNQISQNSGLNFNPPHQANYQQMNFQQQSNNQQAPFIQQTGNMQPQFNQFSSSQQPSNSVPNSQLLQQQNQNLASNIFSALHNIRQSSQNQAKSPASQQTNCCSSKQNIEQFLPQFQNQPSPTVTYSNGINKPEIGSQQSTTAFVESQQFQPMFTFQAVPSTNFPSEQNQQNMISPSAVNSYTNGLNQGYSQNPPNLASSQQSTTLQTPMLMIPGVQTNNPQNQPIVLTFQAPQMSSVQGQPTFPTSQSQPIIYTVQTQPSLSSNKNQQMVSNHHQGSNNVPTDNQSLMSYMMSQMQNTPGNNNPMEAILPEMLNTKSGKSSSMKALLPLIFNMLNERRNGCGGCVCPHCGSSNNNNQNIQEPVINSGYSNQKNYSQQEPIEEVLSTVAKIAEKNIKPKSNIPEKTKYMNNEITDNSTEVSEEDDDEESLEDEEDE